MNATNRKGLLMHSLTALIVAAMAAAGIAASTPAAADPATPAPNDCGRYGGISAALDQARDHLSPPLGTPAPPNPNWHNDPPLPPCK